MALRPVALALAAVLCLAVLLAGCTSSDSGSSSASGSASAYVKDKPSEDFREVHVVFTQVSVHRSGGGVGDDNSTGTTTATGVSTTVGNTTLSVSATASASSSNSTSQAPEAGWIVVFSDSAGVDVDLLNTTGAKAAFLGEADLEAGNYQQIRMTVTSAYGIGQDGARHEITVSSGTLKSVRSFQVEAGKETRITIDLDLEKSLHQTGNGQWRMTPVIGKTTTQVVADKDSGEDKAKPGDVEDVPESG